jgi:ABC-2 type transport system ATP-binding protein
VFLAAFVLSLIEEFGIDMENMIYADDLRKEFKKIIKEPGIKGSVKALFKPHKEIVKAVDGITFSVPKGEILGFIGPNGAGKSTVIKMLTGILTPTSGTCRINGKIPQEDRKNYVREIGVVFGQRTQLWWDLALRETYAVLKEIYQVPDDKYKKRMDFLNEVLELDSFITSPVRTLSLGQRMRADIAASLLHSPKVLFLDEPTICLDVVVKENIRNAIRRINAEEGTTVILTTHDLSDIELLCERIVMVDKGKKVFDGAISELKRDYGDVRTLNFELVNSPDFKLLDYKRRFNLTDDDISVGRDGGSVKVRFDTAAVSVEEIISYTLSTVHVKDLNIKDVEIEEIIKKLYRREVRV